MAECDLRLREDLWLNENEWVHYSEFEEDRAGVLPSCSEMGELELEPEVEPWPDAELEQEPEPGPGVRQVFLVCY